ncbi:MAG: hypothetical protein E7197_08130 [Anaerovibrio sp.]|uniref:hypothetical protein n=1 Tax=Anaerovibrio sp. TaxID=1872532 RepID=UPI0025BE93FE|nr:hypothetical protein [Anaerovibrio sp.]MBE6100008.1 hypothetical protein [Anaerovibrio sp.]
MIEHRDRASGWKHAKLSGHINEDNVKFLLDTNEEYSAEFLKRIGRPNDTITDCTIGGLHETNVQGVLGRKTKSKTDLKVYCNSGKQVNVSIKKSLNGQVYFVDVELFFQIFEKQFGKAIPKDVQRAMRLFWAAADDAVTIIEQYADKTDIKSYNLQVRHKSLNATTLKNYDQFLYDAMLNWFRNNAYELAKLSFAMGAAAEPDEWSEYVWYINTLGENQIDEIFHIDKICHAAKDKAVELTYYGDSNGGTTIQLPFGFVQWHQKKMQFHHGYLKIKELYD